MKEARAAGIEVPVPDIEELKEEEEFGGFAYEMCYLIFRERPEPHLIGESLENFFKETLRPKEQLLRDIFEPSTGDELAFRRAWEVFNKHERYGFPHEGGYLDQPAEWLLVHQCAKMAQERAESLNQREEASDQRSKANQTPEQMPSGTPD